MIWKPVEAATVHLKDYCLTGMRLVNDRWYGEYGMSDYASELPMDEWSLMVESWEPCYTYGGKFAGPQSRTRLCKEFTNKDLANDDWRIIKTTEPSYDELKRMGFYEIA